MAKSPSPEAGAAAAATVSFDPLERSVDLDDFAGLMREHESMVFSLAYHCLQNRAAAEDMTQDVFLVLYKNLRAIQSPAHLRHWLRQVTSRRCIDAVRKARLWRVLSLTDSPEPAADFQESDPALSRRLRALVATLPARMRVVVVLRYQEDLELAEIADTLGVPLNTVKSQLRRSLALLRQKLAHQRPKVSE